MPSLFCGLPQLLARRKKQQKSGTANTTHTTPAYFEGVPITTEETHTSAKDLFNSASTSSSTIAVPATSETTQTLLEPTPSTIAKPRTQRALTVRAKGQYALVDDHPVPELAHEKEVVIRNYAVGLNPIDWKSVDYNFCLPAFPWVTGREMAGVVEMVGSEVTNCKVGDRVWTSTYYKDSRAGCFQELVTVPAHTVSPVPPNMSFPEAACLGVAALTAAMTLWNWLEVPVPLAHTPSDEYLLVWGGSAVTGQFAIQIAKLGGLKVVAVCSEKTKEICESLGALAVTRDGKSLDEIRSEIVGIAGDKITRVIDLVGNTTAAASLAVVSKSLPVHVAPLAMMKEQEVGDHVKVHTVEMKRFVLDEKSAVWAKELNDLIADGALRLPRVEVLEGGLDVVESGLERLKKGDMNGMKVVVALA